jgi:hypothetical protein
MAITNASDLLVYAKTSAAVKQVTRIRALTTAPFSVFETGKKGVIIVDIVKADGRVIDDAAKNITLNTGASLVEDVGNELSSAYNYTLIGTTQTDGNYTYRDYENGGTGIVPTLDIVSGTATLKENGVTIEIITPGSSAVFDPVAFSTQASFSSSVDLRDVTTKESDGYSESIAGLKSFELSTELLQSINPDVPLDGTDFFHELSERDEVNVAFSDRIRNILTTNLTTSGQDGFSKIDITQTTGENDYFGGTTASLNTATATSGCFLYNSFSAPRIESKKLTWSFYIKGDGTTSTADIRIMNISTSQYTPKIITGDGSITKGSTYHSITGLTQNWTRIAFEFPNPVSVDTLNSVAEFRLYPGAYNSQVSNTTKVYTSSWQFELKGKASDYQDPTTITHYQGNALVSSVNYDAGVEDNLTCSATFTGTGINTLNT